ncbi:hypothetical protein [Novosphingobium sp. 9]|uniref:hypothetical protein n=1 Tax=Novosphingobium sp. 9 TaxID=2025349 RepID=UPI0021B636DE|nr:hypothetical protein [Novosphingobium sp. 9]
MIEPDKAHHSTMSASTPSIANLPPVPVTLEPAEAAFIVSAVRKVFGNDVMLRHYSTRADDLALHIETASEPNGLKRYDFLGILMTRIDRPIHIEVSRPGDRVKGNAKLAYRYGVVLYAPPTEQP